jgi:hypothetical protein
MGIQSNNTSKQQRIANSGQTLTSVGGDFKAVANNGTKTITITGLNFTLTAQHVLAGDGIYLRNNEGGSLPLPTDDVTVSSGVITLPDMGLDFISTDNVDVTLSGQTPRVSKDLDVEKVEVQNLNIPTSSAIPLISSAYELTASFDDVGNELYVGDVDSIGLWPTIDIGTSLTTQIRILLKHTSAGAEEYREPYLGSPAANITTINLNDYQVATDADQLFLLRINTKNVNYIQVQAKDSANGDGQIDALYATKG